MYNNNGKLSNESKQFWYLAFYWSNLAYSIKFFSLSWVEKTLVQAFVELLKPVDGVGGKHAGLVQGVEVQSPAVGHDAVNERDLDDFGDQLESRKKSRFS